MKKIADVTVILRHCGERTTELARSVLDDTFESQNVHQTTAIPFSECLRRAFQLGHQAALPLTLCIDADVIIDELGIKSLIQSALQDEPQVFQWNSLCFDRFFGIDRPVGVRLYRTDKLPAVERAIPAEGTSLRPESDAIAVVASQGWRQRRTPVFVGVHDFHQHFHDVYRKCYLQAHKHADYLDFPKRMWQELTWSQPDFAVASLALADGLSAAHPPTISKLFLPAEMIKSRLQTLSLPDQESNPPQRVSASGIRSTALQSLPSNLQREHSDFVTRMNRLFQERPRSWLRRAFNRITEMAA
jgi:hypothetical protein